MFRLLCLFFIVDWILTDTLLNTTSGIYRGQTVRYRNIVVQRYLGIEYGRIPRRFDRAVPTVRRNQSQVLNGTSFGPICKQTGASCTTTVNVRSRTTSCSVNYGIFFTRSSPAEQCLFLNVYMPAKTDARKGKKAIFMWIHGGSGQVGTGNVFDGTILAALGDVIVVTFNFRLNLFGFLSSGDQRLEGNLGLYDQAMVLDWITRNSDVLNGDLQRLTVGGHSAGAPHAYYLALSPFNQGRIHRLILQSGCPFNIWSHTKAHQAMDTFHVVAADNGCGTRQTFDEKVQCLRERDYHLLSEQEHQAYSSANHSNVVSEGDYMRRFGDEKLNSKNSLGDLDILMGSTDDEGLSAAVLPILIEHQSLVLTHVNFTQISLKFLATMQPNKSCLHHKALELYHISSTCSLSLDCYCSSFYNYSRLISDVLFYNDYYRFLTQHLHYSNRTYLYRYSHRTSQEHPTACNDFFRRQELVGHFAELEYTWAVPLLFKAKKDLTPLTTYVTYESNHTSSYTAEQVKFSEEIVEQWTNFIKYGRPNSTRSGNRWTPIRDISQGDFMHLKINQSEMRRSEIPSSVQFWSRACEPVANTTTTMIDSSDQVSIVEISIVVFVCTSLFVVFQSTENYSQELVRINQ